MKKIVIGVVSKHISKDSNRPNTYIKDELKQVIFDNGAIAIGILPPSDQKIKAKNSWSNNLTTEEIENLTFQIALCDGIILQGGGFSDEYECFIAKYCYDNDIPILGICAGMNNMVRAVGGKIKKIEYLKNHKSEKTYAHPIAIDEASLFFDIIRKKRMNVNSRHAYFNSDAGPLMGSAYSPDGLAEVVEDRSKKFYLTVQFHPESLYRIDEHMNQIFEYFIHICSLKK